ncbi:acetyl-CoA carboxylase biotin carboxylase subunit [Lactiplantibacillus fabifermentans]|uniref:biotin carboxylase n=2 Tax=Lactiplantibacillus fabifermentans TaxID=483011 RepID=A0A0R2NU85_9LACO|nr:acetyl-CoA carboxylase biotin carboxylase subunit [Lactiplantibacillus fabifermentans]ETY74411.1 acetyl-CoA carboxylase biotin carboxylase subunit [Lactiplantibacillus fabifermentans T30PCM01]KRO28235.1 acetyl-coa carboxylase, biotin carboxylase subunit [Lactiplantibacillus fabifermentans DSM 21115]
MFTKVLVANRGEIAVQIIRALREMGIASVAIYSEADAQSQFVKLADEAVCVGPGPATASYLNMQAIISVATLTGCQAIHPGYGFLSENAAFAKLCAECQVKFIGPDATLIAKMGDKAQARKTMAQLGVPVIPGSQQILSQVVDAQRAATKLGYPVMLKAAAGGGGKGIRVVTQAADLAAAFEQAQQEAQASYEDDRLYLEKVITPAKHIEIQVLADEYGHVVYLPERDCSLQRHHQKVIEESPCASFSADERRQLGTLVAEATTKLHYTNTGTFEFLMGPDHQCYFLEMNTRLQVEHTVTEMVTGLELIKMQIRIAAGEPLAVTQAEIQIKGCAVEARFNAEDPAKDFQPQPGRITQLHYPLGTLGVRIDAGVVVGDQISPFYDSMLAKIIVLQPQRSAALVKLRRCLQELTITGIQTNQAFLADLLATTKVQDATYTTAFIEQEFLKRWSPNASISTAQ